MIMDDGPVMMMGAPGRGGEIMENARAPVADGPIMFKGDGASSDTTKVRKEFPEVFIWRQGQIECVQHRFLRVVLIAVFVVSVNVTTVDIFRVIKLNTFLCSNGFLRLSRDDNQHCLTINVNYLTHFIQLIFFYFPTVHLDNWLKL